MARLERTFRPGSGRFAENHARSAYQADPAQLQEVTAEPLGAAIR
jgi:hypothetical protein